MIVIKEARGLINHSHKPLSMMHHHFIHLAKSFVSLDFFHILRANNHRADSMVNLGSSLNCGHLLEDGCLNLNAWVP